MTDKPTIKSRKVKPPRARWDNVVQLQRAFAGAHNADERARLKQWSRGRIIVFTTAPYTRAEAYALLRAFRAACASGVDKRAAVRLWWPRIRVAAHQVEFNRRMMETESRWDHRTQFRRKLQAISQGKVSAESLRDVTVRQALMSGGRVTESQVLKAAPVVLAEYATEFLNGPLMKALGAGGRPPREAAITDLAAVLAAAFEDVAGRPAGTSCAAHHDDRYGPAVTLLRAGLSPFYEVSGHGIRKILIQLRRSGFVL